MIIEGLEQGSREWLAMRSGMCTGSRVADVLAKHKKGDASKKRADYAMELVLERLTGLTAEHFVSAPMKWGMDYEPLARDRYEAYNHAHYRDELMVQPIGFAIHDRLKWFGASPDALVGDDGLLEIKCPKPGTHLSYLMAGVVPEQYMPQILAELSCTGRQWCDFVSFDPRLPDKFQLFIRRVERDEAKIAEMEAEVEKFLAEVDQAMKRLEACNPLTDDLTKLLEKSVEFIKEVQCTQAR